MKPPPLPAGGPNIRFARMPLSRFGTFSIRAHGERVGRNPRTGDEVAVPGKVVPHFSGKPLDQTRPGHASDPASQLFGSALRSGAVPEHSSLWERFDL